jgi:hypothetical protein
VIRARQTPNQSAPSRARFGDGGGPFLFGAAHEQRPLAPPEHLKVIRVATIMMMTTIIIIIIWRKARSSCSANDYVDILFQFRAERSFLVAMARPIRAIGPIGRRRAGGGS